MKTLRLALLAVALAFAALTAAPSGSAAQEVSVNPTAKAVNEEALFQKLDQVTGRVSIPDQSAGTLIQPEGRDWRTLHQQTIPQIGSYILIGMISLLVVFFVLRGRVRVRRGLSGIKVLRFGSLDRFAHWFTAFSFIILGLTGLNIVFGKDLVLPLVGPENFTLLSQWGKYAHNFLGIPFTIGIILMFLLWVKDNFPSSGDLAWIKAGGGLVGHGHVESKRFNFGQKMIFWSTILIGGALAASGFILMFPFQGTTIAGMQLAQVIHSVGGIVLIAIIFAHIYIGSIGMEGAFDAMGSGKVDLNWAREHHSLWAETAPVVEGDKASAPRGMPAPAE
jgi:formate dehydrogenase subunit gamma